MLVENQKVLVHWTNTTKQHYIDLGYQYTHNGDEFYAKVEDLPSGSGIRVDVECDYCHNIFSTPKYAYTKQINGKINKCACEQCNWKKSLEYRDYTNIIFNEYLNICYDNGLEPLSKISDYVGNKTIFYFRCPIHGIQHLKIDQMRKFNGCKLCDQERRKMIVAEENMMLFFQFCNDHDYIPKSTINDYVNATSYLYYECPRHGLQRTTIIEIKLGRACDKCKYDIVKNTLRNDVNKVISIIESKNGNKLINPHAYINAITNNLWITCGSCGKPFRSSLNNYQKSIDGKCPNCRDNSVGETIIKKFLDDNKIHYIQQKRFSDCKDKRTLPFDFYLSEYNYCIEFDGQHHFEAIEYIGGEEHLEIVRKHDKIKNQYCKDNCINLLRIPYWQGNDIANIISDALNLNKQKI